MVRTVRLVERRPSGTELAARAHVVSGSNTSVHARVPWLEETRRALGPLVGAAVSGDASVVGVCFGAQLLATMLAGPASVGPHPAGLRAGFTSVVDVGGAASTGVAPVGSTPVGPTPVVSTPVGPTQMGAATVEVASFHFHHVDADRLTASGATITARSAVTPVEAFSSGGVSGVQFHPELDGTGLRRVLHANRRVLIAHGRRLPRLGTARRSAPWDPRAWDSWVVAAVRASSSPAWYEAGRPCTREGAVIRHEAVRAVAVQ